MKKLQEKLDFLLNKYSVDSKVALKDGRTAVINNKELPLLAHRSERRFTELKNIVQGGTLAGVSVMRVVRTVEKGTDIYEELYRELDLCEFVLGEQIKSVMVMQNDCVLNGIATTGNGIVCTLEISATLKKGEIPKDKHEIISQRGIACDVVVDTQLKQDSIYLFGDSNQKYTDVDFELFGLSINEIAIVRSAFKLAQMKNFEEVISDDTRLKNIVEKAKKSALSGIREVV